MIGALPDTLEEFFEASSRSFGTLYRPTWLLSELADPTWRIKFGESIREVDGVIKGAPQIRWSLNLPDGCLTDHSHSRLLDHAKLVLISSFDGTTNSSKTLAAVTSFHRYLMWLVEFWVTHGPGLHQQTGLHGLDIDTIEAFVAIYATRGVTGTSRACERWDEWIAEQILQQASLIDVTISQLTVDERALLRIGPGAWNGTSAFLADVGSTKHGEGYFAAARTLLYLMHAYNERGVIHGKFVEKVIGVGSTRIPRLAALLVHLQPYELCQDYAFRSLPRVGFRTEPLIGRPTLEALAEKPLNVASLLNWVRQVSQTLTLIPTLASSTFANPTEVGERLTRFRGSWRGRTRSIPIPVALRLTTFCLDWMQHVEPDLQDVVNRIFTSLQPDGKVRPIELQRRLDSILVPESLRKFGARKFWGQSFWKIDDYHCNGRRTIRGNELAVTDLLAINVAVCFVLIAMLSCCRRAEVLTLRKDALEHRGGRTFIRIRLRKTGVDEARLSILKPVPNIVAQCFESMLKISSAVNRFRPKRDAHIENLVFTKFNRNGLSEIAETIYQHLDLVSEIANLRTVSEKLWYVRPHELRRFFALSFFHEGGKENSLPALCWFMGHKEIHMTWRYVCEELSGAELSEAEAALAATAVYSEDEAASVEYLRRVLLKHFGVDELKVLSEDVVQEYLEMLHEDGAFTATPVQVRDTSGRRFTVLIKIHGGGDDET